MSKRTLYVPKAFERPKNWQWEAPADALARWADTPAQAAADDATTISIFDVIGEDFWTGGGFTAKKCAAILRNAGGKPVSVEINSPGGDMFDGIAIYNMLREYEAEVTVKVMGFAASAASIIAMAGDRIEIGRGAFFMIHNSWGVVIGNQNDMSAAAETFAEFDDAMAGIYEHRTGAKRAEIEAMMDAETWLSADSAVAKGFAESLFDPPQDDDKAAARAASHAPVQARRRIEALLAQQGMPRSERRRLLREATGTQDAAGSGTPSAAALDPRLIADCIATLQK